MKITLYNIDSKKKTRYVTFELVDLGGTYQIHRSSGLLEGTDVKQPSLTISVGKASRSIEEQALLEFNSLISKARDKGYKDTIEELTLVKTDSRGKKKANVGLRSKRKN